MGIPALPIWDRFVLTQQYRRLTEFVLLARPAVEPALPDCSAPPDFHNNGSGTLQEGSISAVFF